MKQLVVNNPELHLNLVDIENFEKKYNIELPEDYKDYLLRYNGGHPNKDKFPLITPFKNYHVLNYEAGISSFFAIYNGTNSNLEKEYRIIKDELPNELLPIGIDSSGGSKIFLCISGERKGRVYFEGVDYGAYYERKSPLYTGLYRVANSFTDFINSLYKFDLKLNNNDQIIQ